MNSLFNCIKPTPITEIKASITWIVLGLLAFVFFIQIFLINFFIKNGLGLAYTAFALVIINIFLYIYNYKKRKTGKYFFSSLFDYLFIMLPSFSLPIFSIIFYYLYSGQSNFFDQINDKGIFLLENKGFFELLNFPFSSAITNSWALYPLKLTVITGILSLLLSIPLWFVMCRDWIRYYTSWGLRKSFAISLLGIFLTIIVTYDLPLKGTNPIDFSDNLSLVRSIRANCFSPSYCYFFPTSIIGFIFYLLNLSKGTKHV